MHPERERIEKILNGDMSLFQSLIEDYQGLVCHVVFRMVSNETDREEICQEVFVKVYQKLNTFEYQAKLSTWIARIAYHLTINYLKKKKVPLYEDMVDSRKRSEKSVPLSIDTVEDDCAGVDDAIDRKEMQQRLHMTIGELPVTFRTIVTLYHLNDMSYREIGEIMSLPEGTVKSYLFRARKKLKEILLERYSAEELL